MLPEAPPPGGAGTLQVIGAKAADHHRNNQAIYNFN